MSKSKKDMKLKQYVLILYASLSNVFFTKDVNLFI